MRLIDADEFTKQVAAVAIKTNTITAADIASGFIKLINAQPTACDIGKVAEQLEELAKEHPYKVIGEPDTYSEYNMAWSDCCDRAEQIVRKGGVE